MCETIKRASCLGPQGSFSAYAAERMCEGAELVLCGSFTEAIRALTSNETDCAVLPVENSLHGGVNDCLDLLESEDIFAYAEYLLPIDHRLVTLEGVDKEQIEKIYSHEQAFGQCSEYLSRNFPHAETVPVSSTAKSLDLLDRRSAGIVGAHIRREGTVLSAENIADSKNNYTRFILIKRRGSLPQRSVMVFFCAALADKPGSLLGLLKPFQRYGLNLTRIESRPVKNTFGQYRFFVECVGDIGGERVRKAIEEAKTHCAQFKLIGAYN